MLLWRKSGEKVVTLIPEEVSSDKLVNSKVFVGRL